MAFEYIISGHSDKTNETFKVPHNITIVFYADENKICYIPNNEDSLHFVINELKDKVNFKTSSFSSSSSTTRKSKKSSKKKYKTLKRSRSRSRSRSRNNSSNSNNSNNSSKSTKKYNQNNNKNNIYKEGDTINNYKISFTDAYQGIAEMKENKFHFLKNIETNLSLKDYINKILRQTHRQKSTIYCLFCRGEEDEFKNIDFGNFKEEPLDFDFNMLNDFVNFNDSNKSNKSNNGINGNNGNNGNKKRK